MPFIDCCWCIISSILKIHALVSCACFIRIIIILKTLFIFFQFFICKYCIEIYLVRTLEKQKYIKIVICSDSPSKFLNREIWAKHIIIMIKDLFIISLWSDQKKIKFFHKMKQIYITFKTFEMFPHAFT